MDLRARIRVLSTVSGGTLLGVAYARRVHADDFDFHSLLAHYERQRANLDASGAITRQLLLAEWTRLRTMSDAELLAAPRVATEAAAASA